jgi:hypothetical protein
MKMAVENRSTRRQTYPTATMPTNPIRTGLGSNPTLRDQRPKANRLNHSTGMNRTNKWKRKRGGWGKKLKERMRQKRNKERHEARTGEDRSMNQTLKKGRQFSYTSNSEARSCSHCFSGKAISITYSECVLVALGIQHPMSLCHIVICGPSDCTLFFFHIISQTAQFSKKKLQNIKCVF